MRGSMADKFLHACEKRREKEYNGNMKDCENYSEDNMVGTIGNVCIYPWCDYCSFYCPRSMTDEDTEK